MNDPTKFVTREALPFCRVCNSEGPHPLHMLAEEPIRPNEGTAHGHRYLSIKWHPARACKRPALRPLDRRLFGGRMSAHDARTERHSDAALGRKSQRGASDITFSARTAGRGLSNVDGQRSRMPQWTVARELTRLLYASSIRDWAHRLGTRGLKRPPPQHAIAATLSSIWLDILPRSGS